MATQSSVGDAHSAYTAAMLVRCPETLPAAIRQAAREQLTSSSAYVRAAILSQLRRDGYDPKSEEA